MGRTLRSSLIRCGHAGCPHLLTNVRAWILHLTTKHGLTADQALLVLYNRVIDYIEDDDLY